MLPVLLLWLVISCCCIIISLILMFLSAKTHGAAGDGGSSFISKALKVSSFLALFYVFILPPMVIQNSGLFGAYKAFKKTNYFSEGELYSYFVTLIFSLIIVPVLIVLLMPAVPLQVILSVAVF